MAVRAEDVLDEEGLEPPPDRRTFETSFTISDKDRSHGALKGVDAIYDFAPRSPDKRLQKKTYHIVL
jgi:hypothetical protein